ncbi:MAG: trimethylamine methyltransferase family protein, partial [Thermodesulfobacteriota bacterium]
MSNNGREGVIVKPYERLTPNQVRILHQASLSILQEPGVWCYNERAAGIFREHGADTREILEKGNRCWRISIPAGLVEEAVRLAPSRVTLGARNPENRLL